MNTYIVIRPGQEVVSCEAEAAPSEEDQSLAEVIWLTVAEARRLSVLLDIEANKIDPEGAV